MKGCRRTRSSSAHADRPVLEITGEESGDVFRLDPAVDDRRLARSLDLDVGSIHMAPLPLTSRTMALCRRALRDRQRARAVRLWVPTSCPLRR